MEKKERYVVVSLVLAVLLLGSVVTNWFQWYRYKDNGELRTDTVTKVVYRYRTDTVPMVVADRVVEYVKVSDVLQHEKELAETVKVDTSDSLPVVQKTYADSSYTAYVSGIRYRDLPRLDSITLRERTVHQTVTVKGKEKRWHVGVVGGYGLGIKSGKAEPFVGVGVSCSLLSF